ncbi:MAG: N-acetylmuramoyl-L-alanine amidase, partial [Pseudomonadota bacterium]
AGLFISLHANAHRKRELRGAAVYTLSEKASDAEAAALAAKENKADAIAGIDLSDQPEVVSKILIDLAQRETMNQSKSFANMMVNRLRTVGPVLRNTHRSAGFAVLKSPTVPSILVEVGYLSNKAEEKLLRSDAHRRKISQAIVKAIDGYFAAQRIAGPS